MIVRKMQPKDLAAVHLIEQEVMETFWSEKQIRSECEYAEGVQLVAEAEDLGKKSAEESKGGMDAV